MNGVNLDPADGMDERRPSVLINDNGNLAGPVDAAAVNYDEPKKGDPLPQPHRARAGAGLTRSSIFEGAVSRSTVMYETGCIGRSIRASRGLTNVMLGDCVVCGVMKAKKRLVLYTIRRHSTGVSYATPTTSRKGSGLPTRGRRLLSSTGRGFRLVNYTCAR